MVGVYYIINKVENKKYIGCSRNIEKRFSEHRKMLNEGVHHSYKLQKAFNEYNESNFEFKIVEQCDIKNLFVLEAQYIIKEDSIKNGYNVAEPYVIVGKDGSIIPKLYKRDIKFMKPKEFIYMDKIGLNKKHYNILDTLLYILQENDDKNSHLTISLNEFLFKCWGYDYKLKNPKDFYGLIEKLKSFNFKYKDIDEPMFDDINCDLNYITFKFNRKIVNLIIDLNEGFVPLESSNKVLSETAQPLYELYKVNEYHLIKWSKNRINLSFEDFKKICNIDSDNPVYCRKLLSKSLQELSLNKSIDINIDYEYKYLKKENSKRKIKTISRVLIR